MPAVHRHQHIPCKCGSLTKVKQGIEYKPFSYFSRSVLRINVTEMANYTCYAINQMVEGRQSSDQRSFMVYVEAPEGKSIEVIM